MSEFKIMPPDDSYSAEEYDAEFLRLQTRRRIASLAQSLLIETSDSTDVGRFSTNRIIALRIPEELLDRLNQVAADAATNRSHLVRQMVADYLNSMEGRGIRFNGCLLSVDTADILIRNPECRESRVAVGT